MSSKNRFTEAERDAALARVANGEHVREVAADLGVHPSSLGYWRARKAGKLSPSMRPGYKRKAKKEKAAAEPGRIKAPVVSLSASERLQDARIFLRKAVEAFAAKQPKRGVLYLQLGLDAIEG